MANTHRVLYGIRDHLNAATPNVDGALALVKDVLRRGICDKETKVFHDGTITLLEKIFRPLLSENRELEAVVHHLAVQVKQSGVIDEQDLEKQLAEIAVGLQEAQDNLMFPEGEPDINIAMLKQALQYMGYVDFPKGRGGEREPTLVEVHDYLARIIAVQNSKKRAAAQENSRRKLYLLDICNGIASTSSRLERNSDSVNQLSENLAREDSELHLEEFSAALLGEMAEIGEKTDQVMDNLETVKFTTMDLEKLFQQADALLLETADSDLMDAVSGMPNRYGLMARINQSRLQVHEGIESGFAVIFIGIVDLGRTRKQWGRERYSDLMRWLGEKIKQSGSYSIFRPASEGLAIFVDNSDKQKAMDTALQIKSRVLDRIISDEAIPKEFHFGVGVVPFEAGMDEESMLIAGSERMRRSILDDGKPII